MARPGLTAEQLAAVADMVSCWGVDDCALIGAHALGCHIDLTWRETADLDVTVYVSMAEYPGGLDRLAGWTSDQRIPHRWYSPLNVAVDALPTHPDTLQHGEVQWPGDDRVLNLVGLRLVNERSTPVELISGVSVRVPPMPVLVVLKMAAYLDRPTERRRDLQDLLHILRGYPAWDDERRFHEAVFEANLSAEQAGPFVLGTEIRALELRLEERDVVTTFLATLMTHPPTMAVMSHEISPELEAEVVLPLLVALSAGFSDGVP